MHIYIYNIIWYPSASYRCVLKYHGIPNIHMDYHHFPYQNCHLNIIPTFSNTPNVESPPLTGGPPIPPTSPHGAKLRPPCSAPGTPHRWTGSAPPRRPRNGWVPPWAFRWQPPGAPPMGCRRRRSTARYLGVEGVGWGGVKGLGGLVEKLGNILNLGLVLRFGWITCQSIWKRLVRDCQWNKTHWHSWRPESTW